MTAIRFRRSRPRDVPAMAAIMESLPQWFTPQAVERVRNADSSLPGLLAIDCAQNVVGFVLWQVTGDQCEIEWIAVAPQLHRHGIGRRLLWRLLEAVRPLGATRIHVDTVAPTVEYEPYARTRAFYQACGFTLHTTVPAGHEDGSDAADYVLTLSEGS